MQGARMLYIAGVCLQFSARQTVETDLAGYAPRVCKRSIGSEVAHRLLVIPRNRQPAKKVAPPATPRLRSSQHVQTTVSSSPAAGGLEG